MEDGSVKQLQKAKITLADCLACSGCVTTAESVLVEAQSVAEFVRVLNRKENRPKVFVVSIAPQTLASLATSTQMTMTQAYFRLNTLFSQRFGVKYVFDITHARDIALWESAVEFVQKFRSQQKSPVLASACPGWICYAEKNSGATNVLQHISTVKSPQQIMGSLVKQIISKRESTPEAPVSPSDVYHITIMPCWDKKLEASRNDFYSDVYRSHDVDLVLTSIEMPQLLSEAGISSFESLEETPLEPGLFNALAPGEDGKMKLVGVAGTSGSYAEYIFRQAALQIFNENSPNMEFKTLIRPKGLKEVKLNDSEGKTVLAFATAYGFSNIANLVKNVKQGSSKYHYIEVMACPSGCLNGGGQLKLDSLNENTTAGAEMKMEVDTNSEGTTTTVRPKTARELLAAVEATFGKDQIVQLSPDTNPLIVKLYQDLGCSPGDENARALFHTTYHEMEKVETKNPLAIQW